MIEATNVSLWPLLRKTVIADRSCHNSRRARLSEWLFDYARGGVSTLIIGIQAAGPPSV